MSNIMSFVNTFVTEDYFIIFLIIMLLILIVLIMALIKTRNQYYEELGSKFSLEDELLKRMGDTDENINIAKEVLNDDAEVLNESVQNNDAINKNDLVMNSTNKSDEVKEDNTNFYSLIDNYENNEEENAVISTDELERRKQEKFDELGVSDNEAMIQKYEEEQEKKAIISYEQLLRNAANISISYTEEKREDGAPKVNKIEVEKKDVTEAQSYIEEEQFLKILKDFRTSLPTKI